MVTIPDATDTLVMLTLPQDLTQKTLISPTINGTIATTGLTMPAFTLGGSLTFNAALDIVAPAATAAALEITDATNKLLAFDTRATTDNITAVLFSMPAPTIANVAGTTYSQVGIAAKTLTLSAVTGVTALSGLQLYISAPTISQSGGAVVVTTVSTIYIAAPVAGAGVTITNPRALSLGGHLDIAGNHLKTTNLSFYENDSDGFIVRNAADTATKGIALTTLRWSATLLSTGNPLASISTTNTDDCYVVIQSRDNTVGVVEVARFMSAADPYFQIGRDDTGVAVGAVCDMLVLQAGAGSGNETANFGLGTSWKIGNASSEVEERGSIDLVLTTATNASEAAQFNFSVMTAGAMVASVMSILGTGIIFASGMAIASGATNGNTLLIRANDTTFITLTTGVTDTMDIGTFNLSGNITSSTDGTWLPATDNNFSLGSDAKRFKLVRAVTVTSGDFIFENGYRMTEAEKLGLGVGVALVRPDGSVAQVFN